VGVRLGARLFFPEGRAKGAIRRRTVSNLFFVEVGTLAEWFAAVGTIGAFVVALILLGRQMRAYRAAEDDRTRGQARGVAVWTRIAGQHNSNEVRREIIVRNSSDTPIYNCVAFASQYWEPPEFNFSVQIGTLPPDEDCVTEIPEGELSDPEVVRGPRVEVAFTDARGRHWRRLSSGELEEQHEPAELGC
jgi:hypothetical protein